MAKRTVTTETVTTDGGQNPEPVDLEVIDEPDPQDIALMRTVTALRGTDGGIIRVYRQGPGGIRDLELLNELGPDEFTPMMLARPPFNGGKFRIHVQDSGGGMILNQVFRIAPANDVSAHPQSNSDMLFMERMLNTMQAGFERIAEKLARPPESPLNTLEGLTKIVELIKPAAPPPAATPAAELFTTLKLMRELKSFTSEDAVPFNDNGEIKPGMLLNKAADMFITALREGKEQTANALPAPQAGDAAVTQAPPKNSEASQTAAGLDGLTDEQKEEIMFFQMQLKMAARSAKKGEDPEEFADGVYSLIGDEMLRTLMSDAQWFEKLSTIEPSVAGYKPWFEKVRASLIDMAREDGVLTPEAKAPTVTKPGEPSGSESGTSASETVGPSVSK